VLSEGDLKPKLYDPYIHLDAWLAYWAGLTTTYPVKGVGKNLFNGNTIDAWLYPNGTPASSTKDRTSVDYIPVTPNTSYVLHGTNSTYLKFTQFDSSKTAVSQQTTTSETSLTATTGSNTTYVRIGWGNADKGATDVILEKGSTATAYEPYSGEPEMLTDEEALIAYLSGVTDTYPEEFRDPADVRVAAYLKYLVSARWGRPEYPVTNEELYLSMMDAPYIPAGEPSSDIEIDDTAEAPFRDVKMYGDTSQTTYTGKNLFDIDQYTNAINRGSGAVTVTKPNSNTLKIVNNKSQLNNFSMIPLPNTNAVLGSTITASFDIKVGTVTNAKATFFWLSDDAYTTQLGDAVFTPNDGSYTLTTEVPSSIPSGSTRLAFCIYSAGGGSPYPAVGSYVEVSNIQVEKSATATSYEPFVGGVPAPNPDYPQAVNTVTGENVVKICGKNLLKPNENLHASRNGLTNVVNDDGSITTSGKPTVSWNAIINPSVGITDRLEDGATYTFSQQVQTNKLYLQVNIYNKTTGTIQYLALNNTTSQSFTVDKSLYTYSYVIQSPLMTTWGDDALTITNYYQLEKSSQATDFEPYQGQSYEVNLGKNLFDIAAASDVWIDTSGVAKPNAYWKNSDFIKVEPNTTYTISGSTIEGGFPTKQFQWHEYSSDNESSYINQYRQINDVNSVTFTTHTGCQYIRVGYRWDALENIQFELGSTPTSYAPYFTPTELCKIGDYQDYLYENDGKWYVHKEIGEVTLDGSESWVRASANSGYRFWTGKATDIKVATDAVLKADRLGVAQGDTWDNYGISGSYTPTRIYIRDVAFNDMTVEQLQAWLSTHNIIAYYALATPTDTTITDTTLIDQLNALKNGGSYTGTTYIKVSATDPNLPGLLKVEAYKYD
jgi:hypothetical protein